MHSRITISVLYSLLLLLLLPSCAMMHGPYGTQEEPPVVINGNRVLYHGNGSTGGSVPVDTHYYEENELVTVLDNINNLTKKGYRFINWDTVTSGPSTPLAAGNTFTMPETIQVLFAQWSRFTKLMGVSAKTTAVKDIVLDNSGNIYVAGDTTGALDGQTLNGTRDAFISKYDANGILKWTRLLGSSGVDTIGMGMAKDSAGNLYITGYTYGSIDSETFTGTTAIFVSKFNSLGVKQWTRILGVASAETTAHGIAVSGGGNVYLAGKTDGNLSGETQKGISDLFIVKYNPAGEWQWTRLSGLANVSTSANAITLDNSENIYVTGETTGSLDGVSCVINSPLFFITKYNSQGTRESTVLSCGIAVGSGINTSKDITLDTSGNIYITGSFSDLQLEGITITGQSDLFLSKYDSNLLRQWTRMQGVSGEYTNSTRIAYYNGYLYLTGDTTGNLDNISKTGSKDAFLSKYSPSGTHNSETDTKLLGVSGAATSGNAIVVESDTNFFIAGKTAGNLDSQSKSGTEDGFFTTRLNF